MPVSVRRHESHSGLSFGTAPRIYIHKLRKKNKQEVAYLTNRFCSYENIVIYILYDFDMNTNAVHGDDNVNERIQVIYIERQYVIYLDLFRLRI